MSRPDPVSDPRARPLRVAVDTKNLALYTGGIAAFFRPLLQAWIAQRPQHQFVLMGPPFEMPEIANAPNCQRHPVAWPVSLPRALRHPLYDNLLFPRAVQAVAPDFVFTPYHDVRLPRRVPSVMMVHDTCLHDLPDVYPLRIRAYYLHMLKRNLTLVDQVLTVSQTSRRDLQARYRVPEHRTGVVPNAIDPRMTQSAAAPADAARLRAERGPGLHVFYPGGSEHRKNIGRLARAIALLADQGEQVQLWVTGERDAAWSACLGALPAPMAARFHFLGRLSLDGLCAQYQACDAVVYPTLCEGFGRVALEAMELGVPLACSRLQVLQEVAADYPIYFDPLDEAAIASGVKAAAARGAAVPRICGEFQPAAVTQRFLALMDAALANRRMAA